MVPIPASPDEDAGGGGTDTPTIYTSNPEMPGPITINLQSPFPVSLVLRDSNIADTMYVRVFRDYAANKGPPVFDTPFPNDPVNGKQDRQVILGTNNWCANASDTLLTFDVVVADRPFDQNAALKPEYRVVTQDGKFSIRSWVAKCSAL